MISGETLIRNLTRNDFIVCDYDGVIQDIDFRWCKKLIDEEEKYAPYFDFSKLKNENGEWDLSLAWKRDKYYFNDWLKRDEINAIPKHIVDDFVKLYIDDPIFYLECPFLIMAKTLKEIAKESFIEGIVFLSSAPKDYETDPRKMIMVERFFGNNKKISLEVIHGNTPKSEFINEHFPQYTVFIDDRSDIVRDVIDNTESKNKQFILPCYSHNIELGNDKEYLTKCYNKGIVISTYQSEIL